MNKKVKICLWAGEGEQKLNDAGYARDQEIVNLSDDEVNQIVMEIFNNGLNVMLYHYDDYTIIYVDTKKFSRR